MTSAPKDLKPNEAGFAERKTFRAHDFFSGLLRAPVANVGRRRDRVPGRALLASAPRPQ